MAITVDSLTSLSDTEVQQTLERLTQRVNELAPDLDLRRGVLHDLLLYLHAAIATRIQKNISRYESAASLLDIQADPSLADEEVVDRVLADWGLVRNTGSRARGQVIIVLNNNYSVTIGAGAVFTANGVSFVSDAAFTAKSSAALINSSTDRLLTRLNDGNWAFTIDVTAVEPGSSGMLKKDTLIIPAAKPVGYVTSYVADDFSGGVDPETNEALLTRMQEGRAARSAVHRPGMLAALRNADSAFAAIVAASIVGFGDAEMQRDRHSVWPGSTGGRLDMYVKTQETVRRATVRKTATLVGMSGGNGIWQVAIGSDDYPGFYEAVSIRRPQDTGLGTLSIVEDTRDMDGAIPGFRPDMASAAEAFYSRYQTAMIKFIDNLTDHTGLSVGATAEYDVTLSGVPLIKEIQDWYNDPDNRPAGCDVLVRAPVPCFVQLSFSVIHKPSSPDPDISGMKQALCRHINTLGFTGKLYASDLYDIAHDYIGGADSLSAIHMLGRVRYPDGTSKYLTATECLAVPYEPDKCVSSKTVQFFIDANDIAVSVAANS